MSRRGLRLVLLGKQGAGKGTQAARLAEHYGVEHLSTGEVFRAASRVGTPLGREAQAFMDRGELVPDELAIGLVREHLTRENTSEEGFVLDGFPRTRLQAEELERILTPDGVDVVVDIQIPTELALHRISGRRVCVNCGATYHVDRPPGQDWSCDVCGGDVRQRDDDTESVVLRRLELYETETLPLVDFYRDHGKLVTVDGAGDSDEVHGALVKRIEEHRA